MSEFRSMSYSQALRKYPTNYKLRAMGRKKFDSMYNRTEQKNNKTVTKLKSNKLQMAPKGRVFLIANNPKGGTAEDFRSKRKIETDNKKSTSDKERRIEKDNVKKTTDKPKVVTKPTVEKKDFDKLSFNEKIDALNRSKSEKDQARAQKMKEQMKKIKARLKARRDLKNKKKQSSGAKARKERR